MAFVPLHVHTEYSLLDGMSTVEELANAASKCRFPGIAITDHGTMMGAKEFHWRMRKQGIKPIIGDEIYLTDYDHKLKDDEHKHYNHLILLAKNEVGYHNLCKIASIGATEGFYRKKARVNHDVVKQYSEGLICLSACIGGEIPQCILEGDVEGAKESIKWYKEVFGEDFYLEVCIHPSSRPGNPQNVYQMQKQVCDELFRLGDEMGVKVVATNDSHFTYKTQAFAHDVMLAMNCGKKVSDMDRLHYTGEEYLKDEAEMLAVFPEHPEAISNTIEVLSKVEEYELDTPVQCPIPFKLNEGETAFSVLASHAYEGFRKRFSPDYKEGRDRLEKELSLIHEKGFENYFLLMEDIVNYARKEGIAYGPGRGFAASSLVNYCLGITKVNPLAYGLRFEKLLNGRTMYYMGVDLDFEYGASGRMVQYLKDKFGDRSVGGLVTLCVKGCRKLIEEACNALEVDSDSMENLMDLIPDDGQIIVNGYDGEHEFYKVSCSNLAKYVKGVRDLLESSKSLRDAFNVASTLEGHKMSQETSLCAVMVSDRDLSETVPVMLGNNVFSKDTDYICQYEKYHSEDVGLLRLNFLELRTLNVIKDTLKEIEASGGSSLCLDGLSSDPETDMLFHLGDTDGVFQFETDFIRRQFLFLKKAPRFTNLVALHALYRPGPIEKIPDYITGINEPARIKEWGIPELDSILLETSGILTFQEQGVDFFREFLHKSETDSVRAFKVMARAKSEQRNELKKEFLLEGNKRGIKEKTLVKTWDMLERDSMYAFNKSHAVCYVSIAYQCAYLKAHYRELYMKNWRRYSND